MEKIIQALEAVAARIDTEVDINVVSHVSQSRPTLVVLRGYPGSGKSTFSECFVLAEHSVGHQSMVVSRDVLRESVLMIGKKKENSFSVWGEKAITNMVNRMIADALKEHITVVVDQTNLRRRHLRDICSVGHKAEANIVVVTMLTDFKVCKQRVEQRHQSGGRYVDAAYMDKNFSKYGEARDWAPLMLDEVGSTFSKFAPYECKKPHLRPVILFDIDGTLAKIRSGELARSPFDWGRVDEDMVNAPVLRQLYANQEAGYEIILMSGRSSVSRDLTEKWLHDNGISYDLLLMRAEKDNRKDSIVKRELLSIIEENHGPVVGIFDDRDQVVDMYRSIGLPVFQVDYGNF